MSGDSPPEGAACALHPERLATWVCGRCGTFMCSDCERRTRPEARPMCPGCWELRGRVVPSVVRRSGGTSLPTVGLVLGVISLVPMCIAIQVGSLVINLVALFGARRPPESEQRWKALTGLGLTLLGGLFSAASYFVFSESP